MSRSFKGMLAAIIGLVALAAFLLGVIIPNTGNVKVSAETTPSADDQAIEGVAVVLVTGQAANQVNMLDFCLQDLYVKRCTGCLQVLSAGLLNAQFPNLLFDHDLPE